MALIRVAQYNSTPTVVEDYQAQNAHLQAFTNQLMTQQFILDSGTAQPIIKQGCYVSHGGSLYIADADTAITGSPSDGSVYIRVSGTTSLTVEFVTDISGYAWNPVYTALTSGSYTLLPYLIVKASSVWTRYNFNPNNHSFGIVKTTGLDTGSGAMIFDQEVKTTSSPTFASINTGQGATEVHLMNQNIRTSDSVEFASVLASLNPLTAVQGTFIVPANGTYTIPRGVYVMAGNYSNIYLGYYITSWKDFSILDYVVMVVISDGTSTRLRNTGNQAEIKYLKF
jgi:hypothetical protein